MVTQAEFFASKYKSPIYECMTFYHVDFDAPIRLVVNQFQDITLNGNVYTAVAATLNTTNADSETPKISISFPRAVIGRAFKQQLALIQISARPTEITGTYEQWIPEVDAVSPVKSRVLYVTDTGGISWNGSAVSVSMGERNIMRQRIPVTYEVDDFTGLISL